MMMSKTRKSIRKVLLILSVVSLIGVSLLYYFSYLNKLELRARHALVNDYGQEAEVLYKEALKLNPLSLRYKLGLAGALQLQKRFDEAGALYLQLYERMPENLGVLGGLTVYYLSRDRLDDAEKMCKQVIAIDPKESIAWYDLAEIYRRRGDYVKAEEYAIKSIEVSGEYSAVDTMGLKKTVEIYNELGRYGEAIYMLREIDRRNPTEKMVFFELGKTQEFVKDVTYSRNAWKEFLKISAEKPALVEEYRKERLFAEKRLNEIENGNFLTPPTPKNPLNWGEIPNQK